MTTSLTPEDRRTLGDLADMLIPAAPGAISATDAGIAGPLLGEIEKYAPERLDLLRLVIRAATSSGAAGALEWLKKDDRVTYDSFCETIAAAYFMSPEVRRKVGFPGREAVPAKTDIADLEELLLPVLEGGFEPRSV